MRKINFIGLAAVLLASVLVAGCSFPGVCTAVGWINTVGVELKGNATAVAAVEVCADGVCSSTSPLQPASDEPLRLVTEIPQQEVPQQSATPAPASTSSPLLYSVGRIDERTWKISLDMQSPETLTLRAVSATGEVLAEQNFSLEWRRVGGTDQCGGPHEAGPITLDIPS